MGHRKCLWRDSSRDTGRHTTACFHCSQGKKSCRFARDALEMVAGGSPKKKVKTLVGKGKEKEMEAEVARTSELGSVEVLERILTELQGMQAEMRVGMVEIRMELGEIWRDRKSVV